MFKISSRYSWYSCYPFAVFVWFITCAESPPAAFKFNWSCPVFFLCFVVSRWFVPSRGFVFGFWWILIFLSFAVSMEICVCLVGEAQRPAERVSTVNIDHNTIYWVRCNQLTPGGSITMETCSKHTFFLMCTQQLVLYTKCLWYTIKCLKGVIWGLCLSTPFSFVQLEVLHISENKKQLFTKK